MKRYAIAAAITAVLGGCAILPISPIDEHSTLVPGTVTVRPIGNNYKVLAQLDANGERIRVAVFATACEQGHGDISADVGRDRYAKNAVKNGNAPKDKLFTQICNEGLPQAYAMEAKLTPEQRAARNAATDRAIHQYLLERARRPESISPSVYCISNRIGTFTHTNCH